MPSEHPSEWGNIAAYHTGDTIAASAGCGNTDAMATTDRPRGTWARPRSAADLGAFLRGARLEENLSQEALADELGVDRRVLQRIEGGEPTLYATRLFALMARLGVDMELHRR